ncbi:MAG: hypothetical protein ACOYD4_09140 [Solirubrobacterales bacterium]
MALASIAAGCGSDSSTAAALKKPAFVQQANAICLEATDQRKQASKELVESGEEGGSDEAAEGTEALLSPVREMTEELGELGAPKGDEKQVEDITAAFEAGIAKLEEEPTGPKSASAFAKANELAAAYGLTDCAI